MNTINRRNFLKNTFSVVSLTGLGTGVLIKKSNANTANKNSI